MSEYARVCKSMPKYARVCQSMPEYARVCQSMPEYARKLDKSSKSYCKNSSTFPGFLKVVFFDPKRYIFHPTRRMSDFAAVGFSALRFLHFLQVWLKFKYSAYNLTSFTQNVGFGGRQNFRKTLHLSPSISDSIWRHSAFLGNHTVGYNKWDLLT